MDEGLHTPAASSGAGFRDPALDPQRPWFDLATIVVASVLATAVAGLLMIGSNYAAWTRPRLALAWRILVMAVVAPAVVAFEYLLLVMSYNHDSGFTWMDMTIAALIQALAVAALAWFLQGQELSARGRAGLPMRSWRAGAGRILATWAVLALWLIVLAFAPRMLAQL